MVHLDKTDWEILDATADDCENLEQIYLSVCFEFFCDSQGHGEQAAKSYRRRQRTVSLSEIADRVRSLVDRRLLKPVMDEDGGPVTNLEDLRYVWRAWFSMTPEGRNTWEASEYASSV
ncbi:MAG TPA: hypothetical protein VG013_11220 [Gemmataceae bacterium]|nr:hypothetical protein [Gemmataceae bacterium]